MPTPEGFGRSSLCWRITGALASAVVVAVILGCMSLHIGPGERHHITDSVGVSTDANGVVRQEGTITLGPGCNQQVFYPIPYANVPNLEIHEPGCIRVRGDLTHQDKNSFTLTNKDEHFSRGFRWVARGVREVPVSPPWPPPGSMLPAPKEVLPLVPVPVTPGK